MKLCQIAGLVLAASVTSTAAQTVYKCEAQGKTVYSHEPCLGAAVVDTTPTQGLDKSSGTSRKGADVRKSENNKAMSDALRPLLGETQAQYETRHRRRMLSPEHKLECSVLDARLPVEERAGRTSGLDAKAEAQVSLLKSRVRYRELRC